MTQRVEHFYLQRHYRSSWQTLYDAATYRAVDLVLQTAGSQFASFKIRIIRALWNKNSKKWDYQLVQMIDLGQTDYISLNQINFLERNSKDMMAIASDCEKILPKKKIDEKTNKKLSRKSSRYKIFTTTLLVFFVSSIGCILFIKNEFPILFDQLNFLQLHSDSTSTSNNHQISIGKEAADPITVGKATKTYGVAEKLFGKWAINSCSYNYVIFTPFEIQVFSKIKSATPSSKYQVAETIEDDFNFFIKIEPGNILHYLKITSDNIRYAGITKKDGFVANLNNQEVYQRCP